MKQKIEELLNKRLNFILEKEFKDITNEEFAVLEFALTKINTNESEEEVKEIYLSDLGCTTLSKKYNVSKTNIRYIKNKQQWKWLTDTFD